MYSSSLSIIRHIAGLEVYLTAMLYIYTYISVSKEISKSWQLERPNYSELKGVLCLCLFNPDFYFASQSIVLFNFSSCIIGWFAVLKTIVLANKSQSDEEFSYACSMAKAAWPVTVQLYNVTSVIYSLYKM